MCFGSESNANEGPERPVRPMQIGRPQDPILHIPRPQIDRYGRPVRIEDHELDHQTLENALQLMAQYLHSKRQELTIIAVGGAVSVLFLRTRQSTHDMDFFGTNLDNHQRILLEEAARYAERRSGAPLGGEWFNNQTMMWLSPVVHAELTRAALQQNNVVFHQRGLKVVAAPWGYAFSAKVQRLGGNTARGYDRSDAVGYLRQFIQTHGNKPIKISDIRNWARMFNHQHNPSVIRQIAEDYQRRYNCRGIVN